MSDRLLEVRVTPRAGADLLSVDADNVVRARVRAAPHDGEANEAVVRLLSKALKSPRSSVRIAAGHTSRSKLVEVDGLTRAEILSRLADRLSKGSE